MYFPYLYGRRAELLALRDVAAGLARWKTLPVIEPTNLSPGDLLKALETFVAKGAACYVVVNPNQGEFKGVGFAPWLTALGGFVANPAVVRPTFQLWKASERASLQSFLRGYHGRDVGVVVRTAELPPADLAADLAGSSARVFLHARSNPGAYLRMLPGLAVEVAPRFNVQVRNADYSGTEWFTSEHLTYASGGLPGVSDFGPLPPTFSLSGGQAAAVAIHLTYRNPLDGSLWIEHFVSDSTAIGDGDVNSKVSEATAKVAAAVAASPAKFVRSPGLRAYLDQHASGRPTNLTMNKRQQISHHLATIGPLL